MTESGLNKYLDKQTKQITPAAFCNHAHASSQEFKRGFFNNNTGTEPKED